MGLIPHPDRKSSRLRSGWRPSGSAAKRLNRLRPQRRRRNFSRSIAVARALSVLVPAAMVVIPAMTNSAASAQAAWFGPRPITDDPRDLADLASARAAFREFLAAVADKSAARAYRYLSDETRSRCESARKLAIDGSATEVANEDIYWLWSVFRFRAEFSREELTRADWGGCGALVDEGRLMQPHIALLMRNLQFSGGYIERESTGTEILVSAHLPGNHHDHDQIGDMWRRSDTSSWGLTPMGLGTLVLMDAGAPDCFWIESKGPACREAIRAKSDAMKSWMERSLKGDRLKMPLADAIGPEFFDIFVGVPFAPKYLRPMRSLAPH